MLCITNNIIKQGSFAFTQFNVQQFYFKQFILAYFICFLSLNIIVLFDRQIGPSQLLPLRARVNTGVIALKGYLALPKASLLL